MMTRCAEQIGPRQKLHELVRLVSTDAIQIDDFCRQFEALYNLQLDKKELDDVESTAFRALFDNVVWYSPFPAERQRIPNYLGEQEILVAARGTFQQLNFKHR